ncbi:MAG: homocysteine S-methyltransferase family protein [Lachnospiraceae bacterium]|nr:homocysteine S-methyltransferase family protein [Lachnospiraceae bacterium]
MNKTEFLSYTKDRIRMLDGATGTNLALLGMPGGVCPEKWICDHPEKMLWIQKEFLKAGTEILYAPTFTANRIKLAEYGLEGEMEPMIRQLVGISKKASEETGIPALIAGDLTMTGRQLRPTGTMEFEELVEVYKEQIRILESAGADLLIVETMMSLAETRAALIAAKETTDLAVMVTLTFEPNGRTLFGTDARTAGIVCESLGAAAVGVNCSTGPARMAEVVRAMAEVTTIPIIAKPNAGLPKLNEAGDTVYDMTPEEFTSEMELLVQAGAQILGGCCGTTAAFIRQVAERYKGNLPAAVNRRPEGIRYLTSERSTLAFGLNDRFHIIGERINPTGKKALQAELREGNTDRVLTFAAEQEAKGASVLDINVGMSGIDEKAMMLRVIEEVSEASSLPLSLDSSYPDILEEALRRYPGRALVNSVSLEKEKFEKLLPVVAKYGAMMILLPLSDEGLPKDLEEKKRIIGTIAARALELGMSKTDIVVDGLVQTVGANPTAGLETLETIRFAKENGFASVVGLSNISFGLPERSYVNASFLSLAIQNGLTMAIANPSQDLLVGTAKATDLLLGKSGSDLGYIETVARIKEEQEKKAAEAASMAAAVKPSGAASEKSSSEKSDDTVGQSGVKPSEHAGSTDRETIDRPHVREALYQGVIKGNRNAMERMTREALDAGADPQVLLNDDLIPAINAVGDLFDKGKYFLPQLIASAESMKNAIGVLEPLLQTEDQGTEKPVVVIATVEGDIHDIGKNLVSMMLKNYGFEVIDLGKDVPADVICAAAKEHHAKVIALSALMTTTMQRMREVVNLVKEEKLQAKVMIGGAVITPEYAQEIGADGYSADAADAVRLAKKLCGL